MALWITYLVAAAFFVTFLAMLAFGVVDRERARPHDAGDAPAGAPRSRAPATSDEAVLQLEHRIEEELRDVSYDLAARERYARAFEA